MNFIAQYAEHRINSIINGKQEHHYQHPVWREILTLVQARPYTSRAKFSGLVLIRTRRFPAISPPSRADVALPAKMAKCWRALQSFCRLKALFKWSSCRHSFSSPTFVDCRTRLLFLVDMKTNTNLVFCLPKIDAVVFNVCISKYLT